MSDGTSQEARLDALLERLEERLDAQDARIAVRLDELATGLAARTDHAVEQAVGRGIAATGQRLERLERHGDELARTASGLEAALATLLEAAEGLSASAAGLATSTREAEGATATGAVAPGTLADDAAMLAAVEAAVASAVHDLGDDLVGVTDEVRRELSSATTALRAGVEAALGEANEQLAHVTGDARRAVASQGDATDQLRVVAERLEHGVVARVEALGEQLAEDVAVALDEGTRQSHDTLVAAVRVELTTRLDGVADAVVARLARAATDPVRTDAAAADPGRRVVRRVVAQPGAGAGTARRPAADPQLLRVLEQVDGVGPARRGPARGVPDPACPAGRRRR